MLEKVIARGNIQLDGQLLLFHPIIKGKIERLKDSGGLTYMRKLPKQKLGFEVDNFGLHS